MGAIDLEMDRKRPNILFAATWEVRRFPWGIRSGGEGSRIYRSKDGGDTWEDITEAPGLPKAKIRERIGLTLTEAKPGRAWALISSDAGRGLYRTDDDGDTWQYLTDDVRLFARAYYYMHIVADPADPENFRRLADDKTRAFYAETLPNPKLQVFPIREVADIGDDLGIPLIVDNTAAPVICKPIDHGASIVMYSTTKFIAGHGTSVGGIVVDSGKFDWEKHAKRFPLLNEPDPSYHGAVWTEAVKPIGPVAYAIKLRCTLLRDVGAAASPFNSFQTIQGMETLPLRMERHCENALKVADFLATHPKVTKVIHPSKQDGEARRRADKYLKGGLGSLMGFELAGGKDAGEKFINSLELFYHVANIGDTRSLAIHPATTTHSQLSEEDRLSSGVTDGYVRLSIGIEHIDDILADLTQALDKA